MLKIAFHAIRTHPPVDYITIHIHKHYIRTQGTAEQVVTAPGQVRVVDQNTGSPCVRFFRGCGGVGQGPELLQAPVRVIA
jgi:hypothetical protein